MHEMRNQLAIAVANVEAFIDGKLDPTKPRLRAVLQALGELETLMHGIDAKDGVDLVYENQVFDICDVIQTEVAGIEAAATSKHLALQTSYCDHAESGCSAFRGNPVRVGQLVKNILLNAVRYTPQGGTIAIDCHRGVGQLHLSIADTGPGIDPAEAENIFLAGYRSDKTLTAGDGGTGTGLAVVKRVVEEHGGTVQVQNNVGSGATFTVHLPGEAVADCESCRTLHF